eukprot:TRINITY_DN534_c0_g1_i5.p1 TRINITY_DN534_c0_g1~~TRINITY_DN534_c0_g1_i5.p1  ORF type:complete len:129 (+),score=51.48 TRINITY_DN534_c0_g1_i5:25-387(+)
MIRRPPRSTHCISSAASDVYKRQAQYRSLYLQSSDQSDSRISFKLYNERDLLFESSVGAQGAQLKDHAADFDCPTRPDQVESLLPTMDEQLFEALAEFRKDRSVVSNAEKYGKRKREISN